MRGRPTPSPAPHRRDPRRKLSDHVAAELEHDILRDYRPGRRLPTEPELSARFGVSRTVVRDALRSLSSIGLITVQQGVGIVVVQPDEATLTHMLSVRLQASDVTVGDVLDARSELETALAAAAARRGTAADWRDLRTIYQEMAEHVAARRWQEAQEAHLAFHRRLLHALHLPALELMLLPLHEVVLISQLPPDLEDEGHWDLAAHREILDALDAGDPEAVTQAMRAHFRNTAVGEEYSEFRRLRFREARHLRSYQALVPPHSGDVNPLSDPGGPLVQ